MAVVDPDDNYFDPVNIEANRRKRKRKGKRQRTRQWEQLGERGPILKQSLQG
jgi:hypothetical protein